MALVIKSDVAVQSINNNTLNLYDFKSASQLASEYTARVEADGGYIVNPAYLTQVCEFLINNKLAGKVHTFCSASLGVRRMTSTVAPSANLIDKLYNIIGDDLSYRLLEHPTGEVPNATTVTDITSVITSANATANNVGELITNSGRPHIKMLPQLANRAISFYQKKPLAMTAGKSLGVALVFKPSSSIASSAFPLSFADSANAVANGGSNDYTFRMIVRDAGVGVNSLLGVRVSTTRTTAENTLSQQLVDNAIAESPINSDRVALIYASNDDKQLAVSYKLPNASYTDTTLTLTEEMSDGFWASKPLNFSGEPSKELRRLTGNLYDLVAMRDLTFDQMKQVRNFIQSKL